MLSDRSAISIANSETGQVIHSRDSKMATDQQLCSRLSR